jgi:FAD/FMN-containing dehydrogenase/Fe-S oxidoreductase
VEIVRARRPRTIPVKSDPAVPGGVYRAATIDVPALERALARELEGEVRFDSASLAMYASDASNFHQVPIGVVVPKTLDDVVAIHRVCHRFGAPILNRGGGTSLSGETVNFAIVIDHSKYLTRIAEPDAARRTVKVETGAINEQVNVKTGAHGLVFGPDPSSHSRCTIGGNIGNNSCGIHSLQSQLYGPGPRTSDNVEAMEIVTYDGERFWVGVNEEAELDAIVARGGRKGQIYAKLRELRDRHAQAIREGFQPVEDLPRRVSGYNLDELLPERGFNVARALIGTESTCVTALQVVLMLTPALLQRTLVVVSYPSAAAAGEHVSEIVERWRPIGLEAIDRQLINDQSARGVHVAEMHDLPHERDAGAWLLVQFGADAEQASEAQANDFVTWLTKAKGYSPDRVTAMKSKQEGGRSEDLWSIREGGLGSTAFPPGGKDHWPGWEDSAVPPARVGDYVADLQALYAKYGLSGAMYGHFGQGCIHSRISFDLRRPQGVADYRSFLEDAANLVSSYGGSLSGEHGDGQQRAELLERQYGKQLVQAMREFKAIWDPDWRMNPGKVVDAFKLDEHLKLGVDYNPWRPATKFSYREDNGDFAHAALRCVGVGKCRVPQAEQTMCPSYQVTREEKHTTRGRARLLFEMLRGEIITDGWASKEVFDALDLCLACKGCTNDCPVNVDIPTYKAEFLYHHYRSLKRWRPRYAYAFGYIDQVSRLAARVPEAVNLATQTPGLAGLVKRAAGVDGRRRLPRFAPLTLQEWFSRRGGTANPHGPRVVLFPDTFNNYLHTDVGVACVETIESAGWQVVMPSVHVCCGRPLYDYGFLDAAEIYLRRVLSALRDDIRAGTPVVGMEPSCEAVFKDELTKLLPHDDDASRLASNTYHFSEFFRERGIDVPRLERRALVWGHCHQRATGGIEPEEELLRQMGVDVEPVRGGCCGLAGSWGFEAGKYGISIDCGEQAILPAVRQADRDTLIVADGFSCKTQIEHAGTGRGALHVAQVLKMAHEHGAKGYRGGLPEEPYYRKVPEPGLWRRASRVGTLASGVAAMGVGAALASRGQRQG